MAEEREGEDDDMRQKLLQLEAVFGKPVVVSILVQDSELHIASAITKTLYTHLMNNPEVVEHEEVPGDIPKKEDTHPLTSTRYIG